MKSEIISRLIQIEESAQVITGGIDKKEHELPVMINMKCEEIERSLKARYAEYARDTEQAKYEEGQAKLAEIEAEYAERGKKLDAYFEENRSQWENELFNKIIER